MPYNFAIGVKGGTNFIYHTVTYEIEKYINRKEQEIEINPPTRCLISLDISNMFNEISRQKAMEIINIHFPHLSNYTNLLLQDPTHCWYLLPNGGWQFFEQEEGLPQGCPFSPVFAALVLHTIIQPIDKMLRKRAATRLKNKITGDDNKGGITNLLAYVDDLNCVIPHEDVYFFCNTFQKLATQIGLRLNEKKSVILTTTSGKSVLQYLPNDIKLHMTQCIKEFTSNKETTDGCTILGFPIGNTTYITNKLKKLTDKVKSCFTLTQESLENIQTVGQIFCNSLIPKFYYTLCADVFLNATQCENIFEYNSPHCQEINTLFNQVTKFLTAENLIPPYVKELTERPTSQNGIHLLNPCKSAISASCAPVIKSIQIAKKGIPIKDTHISLPTSITSIYKKWDKKHRQFSRHSINIYIKYLRH